MIQESGEHVLITAGEIHLQRCLQDLRENYAKIEINVSQPIVPFRETIVCPLKESTNPSELILIQTENKNFTTRIQAVSLPEQVTALLEKNIDLIKAMRQHSRKPTASSITIESSMSQLNLKESESKSESLSSQMKSQAQQLRNELMKEFHNAGDQWHGFVDRILCLGPRGTGPNILVNRSSLALPNFWGSTVQHTEHNEGESDNQGQAYLPSLINGFDSATRSGPLCEEPLVRINCHP